MMVLKQLLPLAPKKTTEEILKKNKPNAASDNQT